MDVFPYFCFYLNNVYRCIAKLRTFPLLLYLYTSLYYCATTLLYRHIAILVYYCHAGIRQFYAYEVLLSDN
jgi:hypothetical protein